MAYPIEEKLVIAVTSSALFDMRESDLVFREKGEDEYSIYQKENIDRPFEIGVAYPFIKRLLALNNSFPESKPIEVILFSKNSPDTGLRAFRTIKHYGLDITRACFSSGRPNYQYLPAFNTTLFLSSSIEDVKEVLAQNIPAGFVDAQEIEDLGDNDELRLAFDFDGVVADDTAEQLYRELGYEKYKDHEAKYWNSPLSSGPMGKLLQRISLLQRLEREKEAKDNSFHRMLRTSIITARNAPAHERVVTTLQKLNIEVDEVFFMGGVEKARVLNLLKPHIFFDDQKAHLSNIGKIPGVLIPFGVSNRSESEGSNTTVR